MGADGAATLGDSTHPTIKQPVKKLTIINDSMIVGISGHVGLAQQFIWELEKQKGASFYRGHGNDRRLKSPEEIAAVLEKAFLPHIQRRIEAVKSTFGDAADAACDTLIAMPFDDKPKLLSLNKQASSELASEGLPFVTIGSGRLIADSFLAFLKEVFWKDSQPKLADAIFATVWALDHAIENAPGYLGKPKQIVVLEKNKTWKARGFSEDELELKEHQQHIDAAKEALRKFKEEGAVTPPPPPPQ